MSDHNLYDVFSDYKSTLKECSKDNSDPKNVKFMTESQLEVINFDGIKTKYTNDLALSEICAASVDALLQMDEDLAFVEFKNGKVDKRNVKDKARDSLLMLCDLMKRTISYTREQAVLDSPSRTAIGKYFLSKGNEELIRFDLERYEHLYFREVHTYTKAEFDKYIEEKFAGGTVS